jgi:hypothetical protein
MDSLNLYIEPGTAESLQLNGSTEHAVVKTVSMEKAHYKPIKCPSPHSHRDLGAERDSRISLILIFSGLLHFGSGASLLVTAPRPNVIHHDSREFESIVMCRRQTAILQFIQIDTRLRGRALLVAGSYSSHDAFTKS